LQKHHTFPKLVVDLRKNKAEYKEELA